MSQLLGIVDDKIVIDKLSVNETSGDVTHTGSLTVSGAIQSNELKVPGSITANTLFVKKIVTENGSTQDPGQWAVNTEDELNGKGFSWTWGSGSAKLAYRTGNRIWSNANFDLAADKSYNIDNVAVLSVKELGATVTKSNLRQVGNLRTLTVDGHAEIGGWAVFLESNRLGLGTATPNGVLGIVEGNLEVVIATTANDVANIGTYTNHDVALITDNIARVTVKKNGEVHVGDENYKNGVLKVHGTIEATSIVTDSRIEKTSPLEFKATKTSSVHNLGLVWQGLDYTRQFVLRPAPDRLWSSEHVDLGENKSYHINGEAVLSSRSLGNGVVNSNLTTLGTLESLTVQGNVVAMSGVQAEAITTKILTVSKGVQASADFNVSIQGNEEFYIDQNEIVLGNKQNTRRPVKVFGPLTVGVNNPEPGFSLAVSGNISFADKKFITGTSAPITGSFIKGDICWNTDPKADSSIGWVCVVSGDPGEWLPFGTIARQ